MMESMRILIIPLLLTIPAGLFGCGGGAELKQQTSTTTLGQELQDLDAAYKKGLLSEKEYQKSRKELIWRPKLTNFLLFPLKTSC